ncbi:MAG TPA: lactoylglutathione lyase [Rhizobium sp.]|nr:lactoylglutathione lyase [Rhizobium sp.]
MVDQFIIKCTAAKGIAEEKAMHKPLLAEAIPHHFCISVEDRDAAMVWWHDMFGFEAEFTFEIAHIHARGAFMRKGTMRIEIFEIEGSAKTPQARLKPNTDLQTQGMKHICFAVNDVQATLETVYAAGHRIVGVARGPRSPMREEEDPSMTENRMPASAFFLLDPWGSLIEILCRTDFSG